MIFCGGEKDGVCPEPFLRGQEDCTQDAYENAPFVCIGGIRERQNPKAPQWICQRHEADYVRGYTARAEEMYGPDWQTVEFSWTPSIEIKAKETKEETAQDKADKQHAQVILGVALGRAK